MVGKLANKAIFICWKYVQFLPILICFSLTRLWFVRRHQWIPFCLYLCLCVLRLFLFLMERVGWEDGSRGISPPLFVFVTNTHWPDPPRANLSNTFVFAFDALRLPLRFVLTLAFWKAGGAQFAVELDFNKAGRFLIINSVFTPTEAYYYSKNVHTNQWWECLLCSLGKGNVCNALCLLKIQWKLLVRFLNSGVVQYTLEGVFGEKACQYNIWGRCCGSVVCVAELDWD